MSNIDKICQEIERRKKGWMFDDLPISIGRYYEDRDILAFIDSLPEETKDAKQVAARYEREDRQSVLSSVDIVNAFIEWAKWMENQMPMPEDTVIFQKGVADGRRLEKDEHILTWQDIRKIVKIADDLLDDPKARVEFQNHNEEYYYKKVLDEYNKLHQTEEE